MCAWACATPAIVRTPYASAVLLSDVERKAFEEEGFVLLHDVLEPPDVARLVAVADRLDATYRAEDGITSFHVLNLHDLVGRDPAFLDLVDHPRTLRAVVGVLGWNVQLFHTQLVVTPPAPDGAAGGAYGWHQDNNRMNLDIETAPPHPRISVKIGFLLSDLPEPGMGNLCVVPRSHLLGRPSFDGPQPPGALEVTGRPGDAVLFDRRIWHAASTNTSTTTRKMLFYGYSHRWVRPKSAMDVPGLLAASDPVRRQLLGWATSANGYFDPTDEDVPLRAWVAEHEGPEAVAP